MKYVTCVEDLDTLPEIAGLDCVLVSFVVQVITTFESAHKTLTTDLQTRCKIIITSAIALTWQLSPALRSHVVSCQL